MQVSAYEIALIGGGFTIIGALLSYWPSRWLMDRNNIIMAKSKLRAAFAPAQAKMRLNRYSTGIELRDFFYDDISIQASAFEEFSPFVSDSTAYEKAWNEYEKTINYERYTNTEEYLWSSDVLETEEGISRFSKSITQKIEDILHFATY